MAQAAFVLPVVTHHGPIHSRIGERWPFKSLFQIDNDLINNTGTSSTIQNIEHGEVHSIL